MTPPHPGHFGRVSGRREPLTSGWYVFVNPKSYRVLSLTRLDAGWLPSTSDPSEADVRDDILQAMAILLLKVCQSTVEADTWCMYEVIEKKVLAKHVYLSLKSEWFNTSRGTDGGKSKDWFRDYTCFPCLSKLVCSIGKGRLTAPWCPGGRVNITHIADEARTRILHL